MSRLQHLIKTVLIAAAPGLFLVGFAMLCIAPLTTSHVWPNGHDELRFHYLLEHFKEAFQHGCIYPRFLPNANGGYGYPTFIFYPSGFFFAALPFSAIFGDTVTAIQATIFFLFLIGGLGAYKICSEISDRLVAICGAGFFLLTPYLYSNLHVRNDLAELTAMMICPWSVYCLLVLQKVQRSSAVLCTVIALAVLIAAVIMSHPATALFLVPSLFLISFAFGERLERRRLVACVGLAIMLAVVLTAPYWYTLFQMKPYVTHEKATQGYYTASDHVVYWSQLISSTWEFGYSKEGPRDGMSFQLGLPHLLLAAAGATASWQDRRIRGVTAVYILLVVMMTPLSTALWETVPILRFVQFPWRILSVIATMQVVCIAGVHYAVHRGAIWERLALILLALGSAAWWYFPQFFPGPRTTIDRDTAIVIHRENRLNNFWTYAAMGEFTPKTAVRLQETLEPRREKPILEVTNGQRQLHFFPDHSVFKIRAVISAGAEADVVINQIYIPGWRVEVAGRNLSRQILEDQLLPDGRIRVRLDSAEQDLLAYYDGPPGSELRNLACGLLLAFLIASGFVYLHPRA